MALASQAGAITITSTDATSPQFCANNGGTELGGSYEGVYACITNPRGSNPDNPKESNGYTAFDQYPGFQCTELANRYLWVATGGAQDIFNVNLVGGNFVQYVKAKYTSDVTGAHTNGTDTNMPTAGDIISMWNPSNPALAQNGNDSHVGIVTGVTSTQITYLSENDVAGNRNAGYNTIAVSGATWRLGGGDYNYTSFEWLQVPSSSSSPPIASGPIPVTVYGPQSGPAGFQTRVTFSCPDTANLVVQQYLDGTQLTEGQAFAGTPENYSFWAVTLPTTGIGLHTVTFKCIYAPNLFGSPPSQSGTVIGTTAPITLNVTSRAITPAVNAILVSPGEKIVVSDGGGFGTGAWVDGSSSLLAAFSSSTTPIQNVPLDINSAGDWSPVSVTVPSNVTVGTDIGITGTAVAANETITTNDVNVPVVAKVTLLEVLEYVLTHGL